MNSPAMVLKWLIHLYGNKKVTEVKDDLIKHGIRKEELERKRIINV
jgi:hypothetical protein